MNVLVTGGAGYIGSHAVRKLLAQGHRVVVIDDLSHGHKKAIEAAASGLGTAPLLVEADIADTEKVSRALRENAIELVMHFAAFIEVGESVREPGKYYRNNFSNALQLLECMRAHPVRKFVFSSTAAVYGTPEKTPISEDSPRKPINPYGKSKAMVETALEDFRSAHGLGYAVLRYFNVAGANPEGLLGEAHDPESHLIPRILAAAAGKSEGIDIFGTDYPTPDGTCIRDYVHVEDLIDAHILAMNSVRAGSGDAYNIGSENGFSVRQVIAACEKVTGRAIPTRECPKRPGDPAVLVASSRKIRSELGWSPRFPDLQTIVTHAWGWHRKSGSESPH